MSREIDERIVAMYFDNKNFEKNAEQTIKTLDELKKSANLEGVGKGFEAFEQAKKKLDLEKLNANAQKLKTSFSSLGDALKKGLSASLNPLSTLKRGFEELNGYITKMVGINIANNLVSSVENALRSLTIQPIGAGWNQYENTMDSVKTIMSSTGESIDTVKAKLAEMTEYANQTIYSLNDMTSNLGKFTNNGVPLEDATNAMIGLANATADAGQGAAQASMAMYNVSQAIGVGKMTTIDWKSLENANIATKKLKQTFIDAAVAHGTLIKQVEKDKQTGEDVVKYFTKAEKGSAAMEVSVENFRETLSKGWLDKTAMMDTFAVFSGQLTADEIAALGFSKEESARLYQIGQEAMKAATEVRTFSKMMDALKEGVQSTWATSFEYIFGDMQEGTNLWTQLNGKIETLLSTGAENRNNILMAWRGLMKDESGQVRKIEDVYNQRKAALVYDLNNGYISADLFEEKLKDLNDIIGNTNLWVDYREIAIGAFMDLFDAIVDIGGSIKLAWEDAFGKFTSDSLKSITQGFSDFVGKIRDWLGNINDADSRISKLRKGLSGVFNVIKIGVNVVKSLVQVGIQIVKPFVDPLLNLFAKFGEWMNLNEATNLGDIISALGNKFKSLWGILANLGWEGVLGKMGDWITEMWVAIKSGVVNWLNDNGLGGVVDWFHSIRDGFVEGWESIKTWWEGSGIPDFFKGIWDSIMGLFEPQTSMRYNGSVLEEYSIDSPVVQFFNGIIEGVGGAYNRVVKWWEEESGIPEFFNKMWNDVSSLFAAKDAEGNTQTPPIVSFFNNIWTGINHAFNDLKRWWEEESGIPEFFEGMWNSVVGLFKSETGMRYNGSMLEEYTIDSPIVQFFKNLWKSIGDAFQEVKSWWEGSGIPEFFEGMWDSIMGLFKPQTSMRYNGSMLEEYTVDPPIVQFFNGLKDSIEKAWAKVSGWEGWESIWKFFSDTWNWIAEAVKGISSGGSENSITETDTSNVEEKVGFVQQILESLSGFWENTRTWFSEIGGGDVATRFVNAATKLLEIVALIAEHIITLTHDIITGKGSIGEWTEFIAAIGGLFAMNWLKNSTTKNLATISENVTGIGETMLQMAGAIVLISAAVAIIGGLDFGTILKGLGAIVVIAIALFEVTKKMTELKAQANSGKEPQRAWERVAGKLIDAVGAVLVIKELTASLPTIISAISEAKKYSNLSGEDVMNTLIGIVSVAGGIMLALAVVSKIAPAGIDPLAAIKTVTSVIATIALFAGALWGTGALMDLITDPETIKKQMETLGTFLEGLGDALNGLFRGLLGTTHAEKLQKEQADQNLENTETMIDFLAQATDRFDLNKLSSISLFMETISDMMTISEGFDSSRLVNFSATLGYLVDGLLEFSNLFTGKYEYNFDDKKYEYLGAFAERGTEAWQRIMDGIELVREFYSVLNTDYLANVDSPVSKMQNWTKYITEEGGVDQIIGAINTIIDNAGNIHDGSGISFDGFAVVRKFYETVSDAFSLSEGDASLPKIDGSPVVNAILDAIMVGDTAIKIAVKGMIQDGMQLLGQEGFSSETVKQMQEIFDFSHLLSSDGTDSMVTEFVEGMTETINEVTQGVEDNTKNLTTSDGLNLKIAGITIDDTFMQTIQEQLATLQTTLDSGEEYTVTVGLVPVLDMTGLPADIDKLQRYFSNEATLAMNATVKLGEQKLPIDDNRMIDEMRMIRQEVANTKLAMQNALVTLGSSFNDSISSLYGAIAGIKFTLDTGVLASGVANGVDSELYHISANAGRTGVTPLIR